MKSGRKVNGWRSLVGVLGIVALALGLSLKLEGAPAPIPLGSTEVKSTRDDARTVTPTNVESVSVAHAAPAVPAENTTSTKAGRIPDTGLQVLSVDYVDWRNDEGTRLRQAGLLRGPMVYSGQGGGVAGAGQLVPACPVGFCSFSIDCNDNDRCTSDRCDIHPEAGLCSGRCVNDPLGDNDPGQCDDGIFCNGKETCQGAVCQAGSNRNVGLPCDSHTDCGLPGTCNFTTGLCTVGNVGEECTTHASCDIRGTCSIGAAPCDSDADCSPSNGVCNYAGTCSGGACAEGIDVICCPDHTDPTKRTICSEHSPRCSEESLDAGVSCQTSTDCKDGICERCQPSCTNDAGCDDGRRCNGIETCERTCSDGANKGLLCTGDNECPNGVCLGQCLPGSPPCGVGGRCQEKGCRSTATSPPFPGAECRVDSDCATAGQECYDIPASRDPRQVECFAGRCCRPGATAADEYICGVTRDITNSVVGCANTSGAVWYASDSGEYVPCPTQGAPVAECFCGDADARLGLAMVAYGCPKYTSGITQANRDNPPVYPVLVGPVSASPAVVPLPDGPGTPLNQLGDDYTFTNAGSCVGGPTPGANCSTDAECGLNGRCGSYMALKVLRYVGYLVSGAGRASIDFYDAQGNFIEDVVTNSMASSLGINVVVFTPPLTIAPSGWMVLRVAQDFDPNMRFRWAATKAGGGLGGNDPDALWINQCAGYPNCMLAASVDNNFLKACNAGPRKDESCVDDTDCPSGGANSCAESPGILAFELVGDKVVDPTGACCTSGAATAGAGTCVDGVVSWVCYAQGNAYLGDGSLCERCNGGTRTGLDCSTDPVCPPTKKCVGGDNPGTICTTNPSICVGVGATCTDQGTCSTGKVGDACPLGDNAACNEAGLCDLESLVCKNPHAPRDTSTPPNYTQACLENSNCDIIGTCVDVACTPIVGCQQGACCNATTGACTISPDPGTCTGGGGIWQDYGTDCDADDGYDAAAQHFCRIPYYSGLRCMGGPNNLQTCTSNGFDANADSIGDADCRFCVGGSKNGLACTKTSDPTTGCLNVGVCNNLVCVGGTTPGAACMTDTDCPDNSGVCRGRCMSRGTGGDNCEDAFVHVITVPDLALGPKTVTISGSNLGATGTEEEPDSLYGVVTGVGSDPGWWEAFSIDKCARIRWDFCGSIPTAQPQTSGIYSGCPDAPVFHGYAEDPNAPGQPGFRRGDPYCKGEDNIWYTIGPTLPAGTYQLPKLSYLQGSHGDYQMHITVQACVESACCYLECTGGTENGQHCDPNTPCTGGTCVGGTTPGASCGSDVPCPGHCVVNTGTVCTSTGNECQLLNDTCDASCTARCDSKCQQLTKADCDAILGYSLQPPNVLPIVAQCTEGVTCATGSCCTGPGICKDSRQNFGAPVYQALCESPTFEGGGTFVGGVKCKGGTCGCGGDIGLSCNSNSDCAGGPTCPGNPATDICVGSATRLLQPLPCPICTIAGSGNCQRYEAVASQGSPSDLSTGSGTKMADDFRLTGPGSLTSVCVTGAFVDTDPANVGVDEDCGGPETPIEQQKEDKFRVRIYEDLDGRPGPLKPGGEQLATRTKAIRSSGTFNEGTGAAKMWDFQLELANEIVFTPADVSKCWWLEVVNDTGVEVAPEKCTWHWAQLAYDSTQGNLYSASGSEVTGYAVGAPRPWDLVWCLNLDIVPGECASETAPCCSCDGNCSEQLLSDCDLGSDVWNDGANTCSDDAVCAPPSNDRCVNAEEVPVGLYSFTNFCATTENTFLLDMDTGPAAMVNDVFFYFRPEEDCPLRADSCTSSQLIFDSAVAIFYDEANPTQCPCPTSQSESDRTLVVAADDNCSSYFESGGVAETPINAKAGHCYTIRFGGWGTDVANGTGRAAVDISCGPPRCGDGRKNGSEVCDGTDASFCLTQNPSLLCNATCNGCGVQNPCGNGVVDAGEECDPNGGTPCPTPSQCRASGADKQCTCTPSCGNDNLEDPEECDGNFPLVDHPCPGRCRSSEDPPVCLCPPLACGNGRQEDIGDFEEECEFGLCTGNVNRKCSDSPYANCTTDAECTAGAKCLALNHCSVNGQCEAGTCDLTADRGDCDAGDCRSANDPLGGCRCGCPSTVVLNNIVWDPATNPTPWPNSNAEATTRALRFKVVEAAPGPSKVEAIKVTMVDLMHPDPRNLIQYPPPNYSTFDTGTASRCSGATTGPNRNGHHCTASNPDCLGGNGAVSTDDGTCSPTAACTAAGGCAVWVGQPWTFYENEGPPRSGPYRASRLQCTPKYWDWKAEPGGVVIVVGAEIIPSSEYSVQLYASTCMGSEAGCTDLSTPVTMYTRRKGDLDQPFQMPSPAALTQADVLDISQAVAAVKHLLPQYRGQMQANLPELNGDPNVLDIVEAVDSVKRLPYSFSGPCDCTLAPACGGSCTGCAGLCLKQCVGGDNDGQTCVNNTHCPGVCVGGSNPGVVCPLGFPGGVNCTGGGVCSGVCSATGTCFDKCGRCQ